MTNFHDILGFFIVDDTEKTIYKKIFGREFYSPRIRMDENDLQIYDDFIIIRRNIENITIYIISPLDSNEIFLYDSLSNFIAALFKIIGKINKEVLIKKFDQLILLVDEFLYNGIVIENNKDKLVKAIPNRGFEGMDGMKIPKGFGSLLGKVGFLKK
ncbi:Vesicle coat complex COPI zeta subunit [Spraguea lophii 42_110]|uniref:Vesicle coat complex COPI zeta subunit n=1 Tax=Spraguea lophii (strain 42_110) TaxID=1358809 RepID=S7WDB1_SPRLO|nr:Vesicle coat complex COPI zeta subunit [Spraguea lophii 42_110]